MIGCGTIRQQQATEQLLLSDAVDRSVAAIDFSPLAHRSVYLDTRYLQFKSSEFVSTSYVVSALRQQMVTAGCLLQENLDQAELVVEARVGALGTDEHEVNFGVPASNSVNAAAAVVANSPVLPSIPEISLAKRTHDQAASKVAVFAYDRESRTPIWQSGTSIGRSKAQGTWVLGAGPLLAGSIYPDDGFIGVPRPKNHMGNWLKRGRSANQNDDQESLRPHDHNFRIAQIWDPELSERVKRGEHLFGPIELAEPAFDKAEEVAEKPSRTESK